MTENVDNRLIQDCLEGRLSAYEALVEKYQKKIFNAALRLLNDYDDAQDITQTVFVKAYEKLRLFNPEYKFFSWIYRMTLNESINHLNRQKHRAVLTDTLASPEKAPDEKLELTRLENGVHDAIAELSIDHRVILILRHFADLSYRELGYILEIPEKTVKSRLFAARQRLGMVLLKRGMVENG
jgi:RNA polymerase sigma-70 factor (ECF subfamily)